MAVNDDIFAFAVRSALQRDWRQLKLACFQAAAGAANRNQEKAAERFRRLADSIREDGAFGELPVSLKRVEGAIRPVALPAEAPPLVVSASIAAELEGVIEEQQKRLTLLEEGYLPTRKILLSGPPGTGKTLSAEWLAVRLGLPLWRVPAESLIRSHLGETGQNLRALFDALPDLPPSVILFDEFDSLGFSRGLGQEVQEMRRCVNTLLTSIERDTSDHVLVAATNVGAHIDEALQRRFDLRLRYELPTPEERVRLLSILAPGVPPEDLKAAPWPPSSTLAALSAAVLRAKKGVLLGRYPALTAPLLCSLVSLPLVAKGGSDE